MIRIDAFHLPGLDPHEAEAWEDLQFGGDVIARVPQLSIRNIDDIATTLHSRLEQIRAIPLARIIRGIDAATARLETEYGQLLRSVLPATTGYSPQMVALILDRMTQDWHADRLNALVAAEFPEPAILDEFIPSVAGATRAFGPDLVFQIFAGNVPGVAVTALVRALLMKAPTICKSGSGDIVLPAVFARALADVAPELAACVAVTYWKGGHENIEARLLERADCVVLYGGEDVERSVRSRTPEGKRVIVHGARLSLGIVTRAAGDLNAAAAEVANAVATFDQRGCVSPHVVYIEQEPSIAAGFAGLVAGELSALEALLPRGRLTIEEAAAMNSAKGAAEFKAIAGSNVQIHGSNEPFAVIHDNDPTFTPSCLNRLLYIKPVADLFDVVDHIRPYRTYLQSIGICGNDPRLPDFASSVGALGVSRVVRMHDLPWPDPFWHHDGQEPLRELARFVDFSF